MKQLRSICPCCGCSRISESLSGRQITHYLPNSPLQIGNSPTRTIINRINQLVHHTTKMVIPSVTRCHIRCREPNPRPLRKSQQRISKMYDLFLNPLAALNSATYLRRRRRRHPIPSRDAISHFLNPTRRHTRAVRPTLIANIQNRNRFRFTRPDTRLACELVPTRCSVVPAKSRLRVELVNAEDTTNSHTLRQTATPNSLTGVINKRRR